jgi:uncharacterized membrane protein YcaP (DUF421 family)
MSRTPAKFTQADIARALRAVSQCGERMEVVLEPNGQIRIVPTESGHALPATDENAHAGEKKPEPW